MKKAFTLVELLIVITLIAILSVAVLATLNPIEQTNKARDAGFKNDAAEVLGAYDRYYASQNSYPWNSDLIPASDRLGIGESGFFEGNTTKFGVINEGGEAPLISTSEMKTSFASKNYFKATSNIDKLYAYTDGQDENYVCFIPKAKANRTGDNSRLLRCFKGGKIIPVDGTDCVTPDKWVDTALDPVTGSAILMCVPEGAKGSLISPVPSI